MKISYYTKRDRCVQRLQDPPRRMRPAGYMCVLDNEMPAGFLRLGMSAGRIPSDYFWTGI